ncbi:MAG: hypothetical protein A2189_01015 [Paenibacillus sp. RIFOXYA1_FULL_44_5]|nr:MAG: hypothetical protein A2189_01015 [Paenibacillus sp. RIFOXYA1_FULL_44_5]
MKKIFKAMMEPNIRKPAENRWLVQTDGDNYMVHSGAVASHLKMQSVVTVIFRSMTNEAVCVNVQQIRVAPRGNKLSSLLYASRIGMESFLLHFFST